MLFANEGRLNGFVDGNGRIRQSSCSIYKLFYSRHTNKQRAIDVGAFTAAVALMTDFIMAVYSRGFLTTALLLELASVQ